MIRARSAPALRSIVQRLGRGLSEAHGRYGKLLPAGMRPYRCPGGWLYLDITESPMMLMRALWAYEIRIRKALKAILGPGQVFVDVGANRGDFTILGARIVGQQGRVVSVEPEPNNVHWLTKSVERNRLRNVRIAPYALGASSGEATLYLGARSGWHSLVEDLPSRDQGTLRVPTRTLDDLLDELDIDTVDVIKIDVEGAEHDVLAGARRTLEGNPGLRLLIDLHPTLGVDVVQVFSSLEAQGFEAFEIALPYNRPAKPGPGCTEVLFCRSGCRVES